MIKCILASILIIGLFAWPAKSGDDSGAYFRKYIATTAAVLNGPGVSYEVQEDSQLMNIEIVYSAAQTSVVHITRDAATGVSYDCRVVAADTLTGATSEVITFGDDKPTYFWTRKVTGQAANDGVKVSAIGADTAYACITFTFKRFGWGE